MPITSVEILHICNRWIILRKIVIYLVGRKFHLHDFFAVKVDGSDVYPGICPYENLLTDSWVDITSVNFNSKKSLWRWNVWPTRYITIFLRIIQRLQICKISTDVRGHFSEANWVTKWSSAIKPTANGQHSNRCTTTTGDL